jgi:hypothetical protein
MHKRAEEIVGLCNKHNIKVIVRIEPDKPEDTSDVELALSPPKPVVAGNQGRTKRPVRLRQEVQQVLRRALRLLLTATLFSGVGWDVRGCLTYAQPETGRSHELRLC